MVSKILRYCSSLNRRMHFCSFVPQPLFFNTLVSCLSPMEVNLLVVKVELTPDETNVYTDFMNFISAEYVIFSLKDFVFVYVLLKMTASSFVWMTLLSLILSTCLQLIWQNEFISFNSCFHFYSVYNTLLLLSLERKKFWAHLSTLCTLFLTTKLLCNNGFCR